MCSVFYTNKNGSHGCHFTCRIKTQTCSPKNPIRDCRKHRKEALYLELGIVSWEQTIRMRLWITWKLLFTDTWTSACHSEQFAFHRVIRRGWRLFLSPRWGLNRGLVKTWRIGFGRLTGKSCHSADVPRLRLHWTCNLWLSWMIILLNCVGTVRINSLHPPKLRVWDFRKTGMELFAAPEENRHWTGPHTVLGVERPRGNFYTTNLQDLELVPEV